ncbi:Acetyl-coenzyme A carboxylase carboxyl transferase subunit alpha [Capsicum annuum]|uniref:acetyl-CoA carboxytransferase n=1 Tax=Capsicum annuum TaxID=4072 RepID=B5LAS6_CAPAN|nr:acetyl-coenzyme A carboxylase carboxyl transferase subunit alpha, chloroplastic [Capsicum annuum]XP_016542309.1 acetyl-coenzyme A carboxylase carboxyl transferase subunit alpha, chloroplastic isoform X1 [Capsicum annuum]XP_016542310.1 acetyl-coenzyme A carboxylase carboxyl transferase subunit alpha, chloroplastic isoform X1 [Capsicum annuum]XP_016542311.1 acetyl-coenzyme A carboxylase carboxyl transferase subunit alpha, chloroplastic isoform X1 [Capsicum annuum]XP_047251838.1 acetyl-coenzyme
MASTSHPPVAFSGSLASQTSASDVLRSSRNGVCGVPLKALGRARLGSKKRDFTVSAKVRKVKKHEYPWPEDPDLNVKGGVLSHLSPFKPLKEKQKPVTLDFEKPLMDLQKKIIDVQKMANETGLDFSDQIISLENKYLQALKDLYTHLTPIQRVNIARHPNRPTFLDHVFNITEKFVELHGDRAGYDDPAIVTGLGTINGRSYMFMGHQKGRNTKENIQRNFGMPTPHGYRKALRMMYYADHHGFPIITFIDTPGAYADLKSEELGQGEAIAHNLRTMFGLKVPIISIVMGEGGSGGALAIGCANKLLMLENAVFYVASPEACAAILWKTAKASPKAAEKLKITAQELCRLQIADGSIPEPLGGAHADPYWTSQQIKIAIEESMDELTKMDTQELLRHRMLKFRKLGGFQEGVPIDPKRKVNMKKKEEPILPPGIPDVELMDEVEKLKQEILKAKESTGKIPELGLNEMIKKLRREIDFEFSEAAKAFGLEEKFVMAREEFAKTRNSNDQSIHPVLKEKLDQLKDEFNRNISAAPNYASLKNKLDMLQEMSEAQKLSEKNSKVNKLKEEINKRLKEVMNRPDLKEKFDKLKAEIESTGVSTAMDLDQGLKEKIVQLKNEMETEFAGVFESLGLNVSPTSLPEAKRKIDEFNNEITTVMEDIVSSTDLKNKIELLKIEVAKAGKTADAESKAKIQSLEQQIKQSLAQAMSFPELKEKHERLKAEIVESPEGSNGSLLADNDGFKSGVEVNVDANRSFA